ncbi:hypothetical protein [Bradyrhizobium canariense]|uniref:hypothetical protein n=1 Tax=Bradyrhizobium canariense TaxID=255045 RepID=UPI001FCCDE9F|nr:hypothetical protein [Bradyrhizobium canariense]
MLHRRSDRRSHVNECPFSNATPATTSAIPVEFEVLYPAPQLLPGENIDPISRAPGRHLPRHTATSPQAAIEWLLAIDVAELSWEIQRYRILRHKLLESYRQKAIEMTLRRIDVPGIVPDFKNDSERYIVQNALDWRLDCMAADEIEARLASYGFDQHTISVDVYVQAREMFTLFETLMNAAQLRRLFLLKEINTRRRMRELPNSNLGQHLATSAT